MNPLNPYSTISTEPPQPISLPETVIEEETATMEAELIKQAASLSKLEKANYLRLIRRERENLLHTVAKMRENRLPVHAIKEEVDRSLVQLESSAQKFLISCRTDPPLKNVIEEQFAAINTKAATSAQLEFAPFTYSSNQFSPSFSVKNAIQETTNPSSKEEWGEVITKMRTGAATVQRVGHLIMVPVKKGSETTSTTKSPSKNDPEFMKEKKRQFARCVQMTMDPESPLGTIPCLAHHSKGLSKEEKKELSDFDRNAVIGKVINDVAVLPAVVSNTVNGVVGGVCKFMALSAMSEACLTTDPANYDSRMKEMSRALRGEEPELNKTLKEATPAWIQSAGATIAHWDHRLNQLDKEAQKKYQTIPGMVHDGVEGIMTAALPSVVGPGIRVTKTIAKGINNGINTTAKVIQKSLSTPYPGVVLDSTSTFWRRLKGTKIISETGIPPACNSNQAILNLPHLGHNLYTSAIPKQIERAAIEYNQKLNSAYSNFTMLYEADEILKVIPKVPFIESREKTWLTSLFSNHPAAIEKAKIEYLKDVSDHFQDCVVKIGSLGTSSVIKESEYAPKIIAEIHGLFRLRELKPKTFEIPIPILSGQYRYQNSDLFFVVKSHIEGIPYDSLLKQIGSSHLCFNREKRLHQLHDFAHANFAAGRAYGEIHNLSAKSIPLPEQRLWLALTNVEEAVDNVYDTLSWIGMRESWPFEKRSPEIRRVIKEFAENPGPLAFGVGDVHPGQFIWNPQKKEMPVGIIDLEFVSSTFETTKLPISPISKEFFDFVYAIECEGVAHGLILEELHGFRDAFAKGYYSIYSGPAPSDAAIKFYKLDNYLRTIGHLAHGIERGEIVDKMALQNVLSEARNLLNK